MWKYLVRRILLMVPTFLGVTLVCFFVMRMANPDPITANLEAGLSGNQISQAALEHLRATYDLDKPWYVQYTKLVGQTEVIVHYKPGNLYRKLISKVVLFIYFVYQRL